MSNPSAAKGGHPRIRAWWVLVVAVVYGLLLTAMLATPWLLAAAEPGDRWLTWTIVSFVVLVLLAGLLFAPIRVGRRQRPLTRRTIWVPLMFSGFLAGLLALGAAMALYELSDIKWDLSLPFICGAVGAWFLWAGLFYLLARKKGYTPVGLALHRWLVAGSILELVIAVPCHIVVRQRGECCAGAYTGPAICLGALVALLAFGPGVLLLYYKRWKQIQIPPPEEGKAFEVLPATTES